MEGSIPVDQWIRHPPTKREIAELEPAASETSFCLQQILSQEVVSSWQMTVDGGVDVTVGRIVTCHITVTVDVVLNLILMTCCSCCCPSVLLLSNRLRPSAN